MKPLVERLTVIRLGSDAIPSGRVSRFLQLYISRSIRAVSGLNASAPGNPSLVIGELAMERDSRRVRFLISALMPVSPFVIVPRFMS